MGVKLTGRAVQPRGPGTGWAAEVEVPPSKRAVVGAKRLRKGLGTRDVHIARAKLPAALMELHQRIAAALRKNPTTDPRLSEALHLRQAMNEVRAGRLDGWSLVPSFNETPIGLVQEDGTEAASGLLSEAIVRRAEEIEVAEGSSRAEFFADVAFGRVTPMTLHVDDWLAQPGAKGARRSRTAADYKRIVEAFRVWASDENVTSVEAVSRKVAGRYLAKLHASGLSPARIGTVVSALTTYWTWMERRGIVEDDRSPWSRQAPQKPTRAPKEDERPFTDAEVVSLLTGPAEPVLADLMRLAALTGARIEELCRLTVAMCAGNVFDLPGSKTLAAARRVPIHPDLAALVAARCRGKAPCAYLLEELGDTNQHGERSAAVGKKFGRYRQTVGVHDRAAGARRSKVNFHSWRRWFSTKALQAGQELRIVEQIVGHKHQGVTLNSYFGGDTPEALRACVEAVQLPKAARIAVPAPQGIAKARTHSPRKARHHAA